MFPGGIADKLGNEYERKWAVRMLLEVIAGSATEMRYEGVSEAFRGFELAIHRECCEWHQTKSNAPSGNWTLDALRREGVIEAFRRRLSSSADAKCVFISQDPAKQMRVLAEKAELANSAGELVAGSAKDRETFDQLVKVWGVDRETAFQWLRRCEFRTESRQSIEEAIDMHGEHVLRGNRGLYDSLSIYLVNNLNAGITTEAARAWIRKCSPFAFRSAALDATLQEKIHAANQRYLDSYTPFGIAGQRIARAESSKAIQELQADDGPSLILLTGDAGSGKSGVVREVMAGLKVPHLVFRMDRYLSCKTRNEIGNVLFDRPESPISALANLANDGPSVLIIDQIDAISEISGRTGAVKDVLFELVQETQHYGAVRCLLVCRRFDLENDPQYRDLEERHKASRVHVPPLSWEHDVAPVLKRAGVKTEYLTEGQQRLLTLPINLSLFLEIGEPDLGFTAGTALIQTVLEKKDRARRDQGYVGWTIYEPLSVMAQWMSDKQELSCPNHILDHFDGAKDWLSSENVILVDENRLAFCHDLFFDFAFARTFTRSNRDIAEFLTSTEQHLFRRTQVRQILTLLRDTDKTGYLRTLETVLTHRKLRLHIKLAVAQWLAGLDTPTPEELKVILRLDDGGGKFLGSVRRIVLFLKDLPRVDHDGKKFPFLMRKALFVSDSWFDLLNAGGELSRFLGTASKQRRRYLLVWLRNVVETRPGAVGALLRVWWSRNPAHSDQLIEWFSFFHRIPADPTLVGLLRDVVRSGSADLFPPDVREGIVRLLPGLCETEAAAPAEILQIVFARWFERYPGKHPFTHHQTGEIDISDLASLVEKAPAVFLDGMIPALLESIRIALNENSSSTTLYVLYRTAARGGPDVLFSLYRDAFRSLAETAPKEAERRLDRIDPADHEVLLHLHLETIRANPTDLGHRFADLLSERCLFSAGLHGTEWKSFADSARAVVAAGRLAIQTIENRVFRHRPEHDRAKQMLCFAKKDRQAEPPTKRYAVAALARSGHIEWCVLRTIGTDLLSSRGKTRLAELERKFSTEEVPKPRSYEVTWVGSPISRNATRMMTDEQWFSAIEKYGDEYEKGEGPSVYGMQGLAGDLERAAKSDPGRFSHIFLRLPEVANPTYGRAVLDGLAGAEHVDEHVTIAALHTAHTRARQPFGLQIVRVVRRHPACLRDDDVFEALLWYAEHGDAAEMRESGHEEDAEEPVSIDALVSAGDALLTCGINSARGAAWEVLGQVVESNPHRAPEIQALAERRASEETCVPVRAMMLHALSPLFNLDRARFGVLLRRLTEPIANDRDDVLALVPMTTEFGVRLFPYIERDLPDIALDLMGRMIDSPNTNLHLIGTYWALAERLRHGNSTNLFPDIQRRSPVHAKIWASILSEFATHTEFRDMAISEIEKLFFHKAAEVRKAAAEVFLNIPGDDFSYFMDLARAFVRSPAIKDAAYEIIYALEKTSCDVTELVIEVGEILVRDSSDGQVPPMYQLQSILKREYVNSQGRPEFRRRFLDLFDCMAEKEIYEAEDLMKLDDR